MNAVTDSAQFDVIIVGGGVGGAACALALAIQYPLRLLVLERQAGPGKINRGDSLLPAITAQLTAWGVLDRFHEAGARPLAKMQVFHHRAGLVMESRLNELGIPSPYLVLPHPDIERVLLESAEATGRVKVMNNCRVIRLLEEQDRVGGVVIAGNSDAEKSNPENGNAENGNAENSNVEKRVAGERAIRAGLVVGADGASSRVRTALGIPFWRCPYGHSYFGMQVQRPASYEDAMRIELHPSGGVLVVPNPDAERVGIGVLVHPAEEELFRGGSLQDKMAAIQQRSPLFDGCDAFAGGAHLYKLSRFHAAHYHARGAALLGDAVHITNPTAGQGMTMAIEDGAALARSVGPVLADGRRETELASALQAYEDERRPLNAALIRWSHWISCFYAWPDASGDWLRRRVFTFGNTSLGRRVQQRIWSSVASRVPTTAD